MKLLANSSYGYQILDLSQHTVTKYLSDEKTYAANNSKMFRTLDYVRNSLYEIKLAKAQIEHKKPIIVLFFSFQCAKLRTFELQDIVFIKICYVHKFQELELDTNSLNLALDEKELEFCTKQEMWTEW